MPAKFPVANFKSQSEYHQYLESLTHPQLKKVATTLNKILRKEYLLSTKKPKDDLLADIKRLYSFNSESKLLTLINSIGIDTQDLPGPSMNARKPTKKQAAEGAKVQAQYEKVERAKAKVAMARSNREAKAAEQLRIKEEEAKAAEQLRIKEEEAKKTDSKVHNKIELILAASVKDSQDEDGIIILFRRDPNIKVTRYTRPDIDLLRLGETKESTLMAIKNMSGFVKFYNNLFAVKKYEENPINNDTDIELGIYRHPDVIDTSLLSSMTSQSKSGGERKYAGQIGINVNLIYADVQSVVFHLERIFKIKDKVKKEEVKKLL